MTSDHNLCRFPTPAVSAHCSTSLGNIWMGHENWWKRYTVHSMVSEFGHCS